MRFVTLTSNSIPEVLAHHVDGMAVINPGEPGAPFTVMQRGELAPQELDAVTQTVLVAKVPNVTLMALLPCPLLMVADGGTLHVKVTPACEGHV